jgi:hypothetical protein
LPTEDSIEAIRLSARSKSIAAHRLKRERKEKAVEGGQGSALE